MMMTDKEKYYLQQFDLIFNSIERKKNEEMEKEFKAKAIELISQNIDLDISRLGEINKDMYETLKHGLFAIEYKNLQYIIDEFINDKSN